MTVRQERIRQVMSLWHSGDIAYKIAFSQYREIAYPHSQWDMLATVLNTSRPVSVGLSGLIKVVQDDSHTEFPVVVLSNRFTNPNTYLPKNRYISIQSIGNDASANLLINDFIGAYGSGERSRHDAIELDYKAKKGQEDPNENPSIWFNGALHSGFVLTHEDGLAHSINAFEKIAREQSK